MAWGRAIFVWTIRRLREDALFVWKAAAWARARRLCNLSRHVYFDDERHSVEEESMAKLLLVELQTVTETSGV